MTIIQGMNSHFSYGNDCCHNNRSEELVDTLPIIPVTNQSEDDDHSEGQEETRGS